MSTVLLQGSDPDTAPTPQYLVGVGMVGKSSALVFDLYWSNTAGLVNQPSLATPFFSREDALRRLRKLRGNGAAAAVVSREQAPWLFTSKSVPHG